MKQSSLGLSHTTKRTRKREFLDAMELVVPWAELFSLIEPHAPKGAKQTARWHVAMRPGLRRALDKDKPLAALFDQLECTKASIRAQD